MDPLKRVMDGGDGWHAAAGGGGGKEKTVINRIMLRFRPIAPRPVLGASCSGQIVPEGKNKSLYSPSKRVKRKYIRTKKGSRSSTGDLQGGVMDSTTITLQLLPGERGSGDTSGSRSWLGIDQAVEKNPHIRDHLWVNTRTLNSWPEITDAVAGSDRRLVAAPPVVAVESWVTVESVTDTCMDARGLGCTDREKAGSLEKDTCPGFISDGFNRVQWVNEAYKDMVRQGGNYYCDGQSPEVRVWLVTKAELPANGHSAFSCRVRLQYMWQKEKCSKMVPCDVWRMQEGAGLAWRLDMKAALSLGL